MLIIHGRARVSICYAIDRSEVHLLYISMIVIVAERRKESNKLRPVPDPMVTYLTFAPLLWSLGLVTKIWNIPIL